ncbi:unnamed protein product [Allacma fusca]|uniref:Uncharacterized protein n=1 Tax=Allacma fusca TaxID=39272 RepID=A0A8J2LN15_9HEXA|nr:unnamed protein product [Allacma fusca]
MQLLKRGFSWACRLWDWLKSAFKLDTNFLDLGVFGAAEIVGANPVMDRGEDILMTAYKIRLGQLETKIFQSLG